MYVLIWGGAAVTLFSLVGMLWCIAKVRNARNANLPDDELRLVMAQILPRNLAALLLSVIGLMMVVVGILLS